MIENWWERSLRATADHAYLFVVYWPAYLSHYHGTRQGCRRGICISDAGFEYSIILALVTHVVVTAAVVAASTVLRRHS